MVLVSDLGVCPSAARRVLVPTTAGRKFRGPSTAMKAGSAAPSPSRVQRGRLCLTLANQKRDQAWKDGPTPTLTLSQGCRARVAAAATGSAGIRNSY